MATNSQESCCAVTWQHSVNGTSGGAFDLSPVLQLEAHSSLPNMARHVVHEAYIETTFASRAFKGQHVAFQHFEELSPISRGRASPNFINICNIP